MDIKIDREHVRKAFQDYTDSYDANDEKIRLKIRHTYRVADLCEQIAKSEKLSAQDVELAWLTGMLHDVGRFEQLRRFGTFIDSDSVDHAGLGADILFGQERRIRDYIGEMAEDARIETVIRVHSSYRLPEGLDERTERFCHILRDADKIDILRVNVETPLEEIYNASTEELRQDMVSEEVMQSFYEHHAVLRSLKKTSVDHVVGHISLVYELVFPASLKLVRKQGYLERLMDYRTDNPQTEGQFAAIRREMQEYMEKQMA